jgi:hypothetical protein
MKRSSRSDFLEADHFWGYLRLWEGKGADLSPRQTDLLAEARYQAFVHVKEKRHAPLSTKQRGVKRTLLRRARTDLATIAALVGLVGRVREPLGPLEPVPASGNPAVWFTPKDLRGTMPTALLAELVRDLVRSFGREYADPILMALQEAYAAQGEAVVIVRSPRQV